MSTNGTYEIIDIVRQMHDVLHLDYHLKTQNSHYGITYESQWNSYSKSTLAVPIICSGLGLLILFTFQIVLCSRCCIRACKCGPPMVEVSASPSHASRTSQVIFIRTFFGFFFFVTLVYCQSILFGNGYLSDGVDKANNALSYLETTFTSLDTYGNDLTAEGTSVESDINSAYSNGCTEAKLLISYFSDYFDYVDEYLSYVSPIPNKCEDASNELDTWGSTYKNRSVYVFYGVIMLCLILYLIGMLFSNKLTLYGGIAVSELVLFVMFVLCAVEMVILVR